MKNITEDEYYCYLRYFVISMFCLMIAGSVLFIFLIFCKVAYSAQATLSWNPNSESDLAGYKIYYGNASRAYTTDVDVGNVISYIIYNLIEGETYYFAATAYDTSDNESGYSNEVSYNVPVPPDTEPPLPPTNLRLSGVNTLKWEESKGEWFAYYQVYKDNVIGLKLLGDSPIESFKIPSGWNKERAEFFVTTVNYSYPFIESMPSDSIRLIFRGNKKKGKWRYL